MDSNSYYHPDLSTCCTVVVGTHSPLTPPTTDTLVRAALIAVPRAHRRTDDEEESVPQISAAHPKTPIHLSRPAEQKCRPLCCAWTVSEVTNRHILLLLLFALYQSRSSVGVGVSWYFRMIYRFSTQPHTEPRRKKFNTTPSLDLIRLLSPCSKPWPWFVT